MKISDSVTTYRYRGPEDRDAHVVVADSYEREEDGIVVFHDLQAFDGQPRVAVAFQVRVMGDVESAD
jgi:hypothetical protein